MNTCFIQLYANHRQEMVPTLQPDHIFCTQIHYIACWNNTLEVYVTIYESVESCLNLLGHACWLFGRNLGWLITDTSSFLSFTHSCSRKFNSDCSHRRGTIFESLFACHNQIAKNGGRLPTYIIEFLSFTVDPCFLFLHTLLRANS